MPTSHERGNHISQHPKNHHQQNRPLRSRKFIKEQYGQNFNFVCDEECSNDSQHEYEVEKEELDEYNIEKLNKFKETGKHLYLIRIILTDMCNNELIKEGTYLVDVCW